MLIDALIRMYLGWRNIGILAANNLPIPECWILGMTHNWWVIRIWKEEFSTRLEGLLKGQVCSWKCGIYITLIRQNRLYQTVPGPQSLNWSVKCQKWTFRGLTEIYSRLPLQSSGISSRLHHFFPSNLLICIAIFIGVLEIINLKNP